MSPLSRLLVLGALVFSMLAYAPHTAAQTVVQPASGAAGTRFVFVADGFRAGEMISTWLNSPTGTVLPATVEGLAPVSDTGTTSWAWVSPPAAPVGNWQMVAFGQQSQVTRVISFTITGTPTGTGEGPQNVFPTSGDQGVIFRFFIEGFTPNEDMDIFLLNPAGQRQSSGVLDVRSVASASGRIDGTWLTLADTQPGTWRIVARGLKSGTERILTVSVTLPDSGRAAISVSPGTAAPGQTLLFSATGFRPDEEIALWLNTPDGQVIPAEVFDLAPATRDGRASWSWKAPLDGPAGRWQMVAAGKSSGLQLVATFDLVGGR